MNFKHTENLMLSKRYESTEVERRTWLHVPSGTPWSTSSDTHQVVEIKKETSKLLYMYIAYITLYIPDRGYAYPCRCPSRLLWGLCWMFSPICQLSCTRLPEWRTLSTPSHQHVCVLYAEVLIDLVQDLLQNGGTCEVHCSIAWKSVWDQLHLYL